MPKNQFVHLHLHSDYTLLKGMCKIGDIANIAKNLKMPAVALTDYVDMGGVIEFYKRLNGCDDVKPIIGCEVCVSPNNDLGDFQSNGFHLILLAKDYAGYQNLCRIISASYADSPRNQPRIDKHLLEVNADGLIALSGGLNGEISQLILNSNPQNAKNALNEYLDIFGRDNCYLELTDHGLSSEKKANKELITFGKEFDVKVVATNDVRYLRKEDAKTYDLMRCIRKNTTLDALDKYPYNHKEYYFKSQDEMAAIFADIPQAITNTLEVAEKCNVILPDLSFPPIADHCPIYEVQSGNTPKKYLLDLCLSGIADRYGFNPNGGQLTGRQSQILDRMNHELNIFDENNFNDYFLIVFDITHYSKAKNIPIGPGRGSVGGSIVCYLLGISDIDPLRYNLHFERFLNPDRISLPDIDLDVCESRRKELFKYIHDKYGNDRVAYLSTYTKFRGRKLIKPVLRALGRNPADWLKITENISSDSYCSDIARIVDDNPELQELLKAESWVRDVYEYSVPMQNLNKAREVHGAGIIIGDQPLSNIIPLRKGDKGQIITQYSTGNCEELGVLGLDFLGLRALTILQSTVEQIEATGECIDITKIPMNDKKTFELFRKGDTGDIFSFRSSGIQDLCRETEVDSIETIIAIIALYRPGLMQFIPEFIARKHGKLPINYIDSRMEPILEETYGIILYQEQIMQLIQVIAGFSLSQADILRRVIGKKKLNQIEAQHQRFIDGCRKTNMLDQKTANKIWEQIVNHAGYAFNKSHSVACAILAYRTAYLKANYPHCNDKIQN